VLSPLLVLPGMRVRECMCECAPQVHVCVCVFAHVHADVCSCAHMPVAALSTLRARCTSAMPALVTYVYLLCEEEWLPLRTHRVLFLSPSLLCTSALQVAAGVEA